MTLVALALLPLFPLLFFHKVEAANDWTQPCFDGSCSYDIAHTDTSMGGTFEINGSSTSISDITPAAGWDILNCTTSTNSQTIQLVCTDETKGCNHLFQEGAEHTIIRLPDNCGMGPFVRVAKHWIPANQSLPTHVASKVKRNNGTTPQVHLLQIDGNFNESASSGRTVGFSLVAGSSSLVPAPNPSRRHVHTLHSRNDSDPSLFSDSISKTVNVTFDKSFVLFNSTLSSAGSENENEELTLVVDADTEVDLNITISFEISGTVFPPDVTKLGASATINGTFDATLSVDADIIGTLDTGKIKLFSAGLPGLSIADILTVDPTFDLFGEASAVIGLDVDLSVGVHYELNGLSFTVGSSMTSSPGFTPLDSPIQFNLNTSVAANATLEAHLIPTLTLELSAFSNTVNISANLDSGVEVDLNATAGAAFSVSTVGSASISESAEACVDISSPILFNVSASGKFFDVIDDSLNLTIFNETFDIFQKCFTQVAQTSTQPSSTSTSNSANSVTAITSASSAPISASTESTSRILPSASTPLVTSSSAAGSISSPILRRSILPTSTGGSRLFTSHSDSGGLGGYRGPGRLEYGGVQSWKSTGYYRKRESGRQTPNRKRDEFAKRFTCPSSSD